MNSTSRYIFILRTGEQCFIEELFARESFVYLLKKSDPHIWRVTPDDLHFTHLKKLLENVAVYRFTREKT